MHMRVSNTLSFLKHFIISGCSFLMSTTFTNFVTRYESLAALSGRLGETQPIFHRSFLIRNNFVLLPEWSEDFHNSRGHIRDNDRHLLSRLKSQFPDSLEVEKHLLHG